MAYRDLLEAAHARLAALEAELVELRAQRRLVADEEQRRALTDLEQRLHVERVEGARRAAIMAEERDQLRLTLERAMDVEREVLRRQSELDVGVARAALTVAEARLVASEAMAADLRARVDRLEAEIEALLAGPEDAVLYYQTRAAELRSTLASHEAARAREEERIAALDARLAGAPATDDAAMEIERTRAERAVRAHARESLAVRQTEAARELGRLERTLASLRRRSL